MDTIVIQGLDFNVPTPYTAGHVLAENEASALNQLLHENLRNNFASKVKKAKEDAGEGGTPDIAALQAALDEYASSYSFGVRSVSGVTRSSASAEEREALSLAKQAVKNALKAKGVKADKEQIAALAEEAVRTRPQFMEIARERVAARKSAASLSLSDLMA